MPTETAIDPRRATRAVVFAAMADATGMLEDLGPERFQGARQRYDRIVRRELARHGGREVKRTDEGTVALFDSASGAIDGSAAIQAALHDARVAGDRVSELRVGAAIGECHLDDGDVFGVPVVTAARLCAEAATGQILAAETLALAAGAPTAEVVTSAPRALKGLDDPVPTAEVIWEGLERGVLPLPAVLAADTTFPFVARRRELAEIDAAYRRCLDGDLQVVVVSGEAGVGKSRLVAEAAHRLHDEGAGVLFGRCDEMLPVPHQPCLEWLLHLVDAVDEDELGDHLGPGAADLAVLVPELAAVTGGSAPPTSPDSEQDRYRLYRSVAGWLRTMSDEWPTVLLLDDVQWAGSATVELLLHLLDHRSVGRVLLVITRREAEHGQSAVVDDLLVRLLRSHATTALDLDGLVTDEVGDLVSRAADRPLVTGELDFIDRLARATGGNALFVTEILRDLVENEAITVRNDRWELDVAPGEVVLPRSITGVIEQRVDRLGPHGQEVLAAAAVLGMRFDIDLLAAILDDDAAVDEVVDEAVAARILVERDEPATSYEFSHGLVQQALYESSRRRRRAALHRAAAEALIGQLRGDDDDRVLSIAHHHRAAAGSDPSDAVAWSRRAAALALSRLDHATAAELFAYVLDELPPGDDGARLELMIELGQAQRRSGDPDFRETLLEAAHLALRLDDGDRLVEAALANTRGTYARAGDVDRKRVEVLEAAVERVGDSGTDRALLLALLASELSWDPESDDQSQLAEEAEEIARRLGDDEVLAHVLRITHEALYPDRTSPEMHERALELIDLGRRLDDREIEFFGALWGATDALSSGMMDAAAELRGHARRCADELANEGGDHGWRAPPTLDWLLLTRETNAAIAVGDLERGLELAERGLAIGTEIGAPETDMVYAAFQFEVLWFRGQLAEVEELIAATVEQDPGVKPFVLGLATIYTQLGEREKAGAVLDQLFEGGASSMFDGQLHHTIMISMCADVIAGVGDTTRAEELLPHAEPLEGQVVGAGPAFRGSIDRSIAQLHAALGHADEADRLFAAAVAHDAAMGVRPWEARSLIDWADALARDGRTEEARARAAEAHTIAAELELGHITDRAEAHGVPTDPTGDDSTDPSE